MVPFSLPSPSRSQGKKGLEDSTQIGNLSTRILSTDDARRDRLNFLNSPLLLSIPDPWDFTITLLLTHPSYIYGEERVSRPRGILLDPVNIYRIPMHVRSSTVITIIERNHPPPNLSSNFFSSRTILCFNITITVRQASTS